MTRAEAGTYYGLSTSAFSGWVAAGRLPSPLPGTRRWDRKAIDAALLRFLRRRKARLLSGKVSGLPRNGGR